MKKLGKGFYTKSDFSLYTITWDKNSTVIRSHSKKCGWSKTIRFGSTAWLFDVWLWVFYIYICINHTSSIFTFFLFWMILKLTKIRDTVIILAMSDMAFGGKQDPFFFSESLFFNQVFNTLKIKSITKKKN